LIGIVTDPGVGGTFLNWSLHYLAGHNYYYCAKKSDWVKVPENPVQDKNSHGFIANQVHSKESFDKEYLKLYAVTTEQFHTIYFHNFNFTSKSETDPEAKQCIEQLDADQLIVLSVSTTNNRHKLYHSSFVKRYESASSFVDLSVQLSSNQDILDDFINYFFQESIEKWRQAGLTNHWDKREFLALNYRPNAVKHIAPNVNLTRDHYRLDVTELWHIFEQTVVYMFEYLNLKIDTTRWENWTRIYHKWRQVHYQRILFVWYFDEIINYIINGYSMDLVRFDLDLIQEAVIQHELIYKHNLNLKTWQLEKFTNTKQLHDLLEPNSHPLITN